MRALASPTTNLFIMSLSQAAPSRHGVHCEERNDRSVECQSAKKAFTRLRTRNCGSAKRRALSEAFNERCNVHSTIVTFGANITSARQRRHALVRQQVRCVLEDSCLTTALVLVEMREARDRRDHVDRFIHHHNLPCRSIRRLRPFRPMAILMTVQPQTTAVA